MVSLCFAGAYVCRIVVAQLCSGKDVDEPRLYAGSAEGETKKPSVSMSSAGSSAWRPERLPPSLMPAGGLRFTP